MATVEQKQLQQEKELVSGLKYIECFVSRSYLENLSVYPVEAPVVQGDGWGSLRLVKLHRLIFDEQENTNDKLVSVYGALQSIHASVFLILDSDGSGVDFYAGTRCADQASTAGLLLEKGLQGNFPGSSLTSLRREEIARKMQTAFAAGQGRNIAAVTMVPALRDEDRDRFVQGIEKLVDTLSGQRYTALLLAEAMPQALVDQRRRGLEEMYTTVTPLSKTSLAYGDNISTAVADGIFSSFSDSVNSSVTNSNSESVSNSFSESDSYGTNWGVSSDGFSTGSSSSHGTTSTSGTSTSWSKAMSTGTAKTSSSGENHTTTNTLGESRTFTINQENKSATDMLDRIQQQLDRLKESEAFGLWSCGAYFIAEDPQVCMVAASSFRALLAGDKTQVENAFINLWRSGSSRQAAQVFNCLQHAQHPRIKLPPVSAFSAQTVTPSALVSGKELPLFLGMPQRSVPGLVVDYIASFGRDIFCPDERPGEKKIRIGQVLHKGVTQATPVNLALEMLRSHCFITGSTGSGKSNTTYCLLEQLLQNQIRFLVVEPAKGEYKYQFGGLPGINIFWTNPEQFRMLRLNPFSFPRGIHVLEHLDRLIEIFNACWPLYSAMPAILKDAVERSYVQCGWDLVSSRRFDNGGPEFPDFSVLTDQLVRTIQESSYSAQSKGDYTGALVTRVGALTKGLMGQIFCGGYEIADEVLFDQNTIVDLSRVGAAETKSLIMGILVMKLNEHRMARADSENAALRHVTVLEEAHNLLKRCGGHPKPGQRQRAGQKRRDAQQLHCRDAHLWRGLCHCGPVALGGGYLGHQEHQHQDRHAPAGAVGFRGHRPLLCAAGRPDPRDQPPGTRAGHHQPAGLAGTGADAGGRLPVGPLPAQRGGRSRRPPPAERQAGHPAGGADAGRAVSACHFGKPGPPQRAESVQAAGLHRAAAPLYAADRAGPQKGPPPVRYLPGGAAGLPGAVPDLSAAVCPAAQRGLYRRGCQNAEPLAVRDAAGPAQLCRI